jgi:hypothetical protein
MLRLTVEASLPVVAVTTRDTMNFPDVLTQITGKIGVEFKPDMSFKPKSLYFVTKKAKVDLFALYAKMVQMESTFIFVNVEKVEEPMFDAGEVPVPKELLMKLMVEITEDEKKAETLIRGLGGCTLKEAAELARLTMARDNSLTVRGLTSTRKTFFQAQRGLTQIETKQNFYDPPPELAEWVLTEKEWFLKGTDHRLTPRGLLLDGMPGVGKTAGAKFIAEQFGVPLYRVDIGGTKGKFHGESESSMLANLARLDHEEPCVALLDETEKIFSTNNSDASGVTTTMLSQLLWWLAEHRSRVLTIMTTNNAKAIPKELYREGRIDQVMVFGGLEESAAKVFVVQVLATFGVKHAVPSPVVKAIVQSAFGKMTVANHAASPHVSQASLTEAAFTFIKANKVQGVTS